MATATEYADLELRILARQGDVYPVEMRLNSEQEYGPGSLSASELPWLPSADPATDGQQLFKWLFADGRLRAAWSEIRGRYPQRRVRLRVAAAAPELHAVPWELLSDIDSAIVQHIASAEATPFSRYIAGKWYPGAAIVKRPLRVLAVIANPAGLDDYGLQPVAVEAEMELLRRATDNLDVELTFLPPPCTLSAIEKALRNGGYHVLHFFAHGAFDMESESAVLFLADANGSVALAADEEVAAMLARQLTNVGTQRQDKLRLVFLESCQTATRSPADAFRGFAPRLVVAGVPAVIAMQDQVPVATAREFAGTFYRRLLRHGQVDLAANEARSAILTNKLPGAAIPVTFQRLRSGLLLGQPDMTVMEVLDEPGSGRFKTPPHLAPAEAAAAPDTRADDEELDEMVLNLLEDGSESASSPASRWRRGLPALLGAAVVLTCTLIGLNLLTSRQQPLEPPSLHQESRDEQRSPPGETSPPRSVPDPGPAGSESSPPPPDSAPTRPTTAPPPPKASPEPAEATVRATSPPIRPHDVEPDPAPALAPDSGGRTDAEKPTPSPASADPSAPPAASVTPTVAVLPLGLAPNDDAVNRQLADLGMGAKVKDLFVSHLDGKGALTPIGNTQLINDLIAQQWVSMKGAVDTQTAVEYGKEMNARYVAYGQVEGLSVSKIKRRQWEAKVEVQVRVLADLPAPVFETFDRTVILSCKGLFNDELDFALRSTGYLCNEALKLAVCDLMKRFPEWAASALTRNSPLALSRCDPHPESVFGSVIIPTPSS